LSIESDPEFAEPYFERACCFLYLDGIEKASDDIYEYIKRYPEPVKGHVLQGMIFQEQEKYDKAVEKYRMGIDSGMTFLYTSIGYCFYKTGKFNLSIQAYDSSIYYRKDKDLSYYYIGLCYLESEYIDSACKYFGLSRECGYYLAENLMCQYCDSLDTQHSIAKAYAVEGINYMDRNKYDAAIIRFNFALEKYPEYDPTIFLLGLCYYYTEKYDSAIKYFTNAITMSPSSTYYSYRGISYYEKMKEYTHKDNKQRQMQFRSFAIKDFEICNSMDTTDYFGYSYLGWTYFTIITIWKNHMKCLKKHLNSNRVMGM